MKTDRPVVLWVEDNPDDVALMRQALIEAAIDVEFVLAQNAVQAFSYMAKRAPFHSAPQPPDLILIDLNLPAIRGTIVIEELRKHLPWRNTPIVVLSSTAVVKDLEECLKLGATECLTKPPVFDGYVVIVNRLRRYLPHW